jgi:hypothetical protein
MKSIFWNNIGGADVTDEVWNEVIKEIDNNGDGEVIF